MRTSVFVSAVCLLLVSWTPLGAQGFDIPPVGGDATFNVATWNIEHFGTGGPSSGDTELQFQNVLSVMQQANVHLWALQEMQTQQAFNNLVSALGPGWAGVWQPDMTSFAVGYGYIYRTDVVQPLQTVTILTDHAHAFAFRPPLMMRANLNLPGGTVENVRIINLHAKCCGGNDNWQRRADASAALKNYVDNLLAVDFKVLVLGDLNDELRSSISQGRPSPYANFRVDDERYHFGTLALEDANIFTWCANWTCTSGSTIDHILVTAPLFDDYEWDSTARYDALLQNIPNYRHTTSDHVAVYARFTFSGALSGQDGAVTHDFALEAPYPNPARGLARLAFSLHEPGHAQVEVFNALGRRVLVLTEGAFGAGRHEIELDGRGLAPGGYVVRLTTQGGGGSAQASRRFVRIP